MPRFLSPILLLALIAPASANDLVFNPGRHPAPGFQALFAPDGKTAVTIGAERCARVWELDTGKQLAELWLPEKTGQYSDGRYHSVGPAWLTPDGKTLAMQYTEPSPARHRLVLIPIAGPDRGTYRVIGEFSNRVDSVAFSPNGKHAATSSGGSPVVVWEVTTGKKVCEIKYDPDMSAAGMAFTPDGTKLTVALPMTNFNGGKHSGVSTFDAATGKFLSEIPWKEGLVERVNSPRWSPDGKTLALNRQFMELFNSDGRRRKSITPPDVLSFPDAAAFNSKGRFLVAWRKNGEYTIRDELAGREVTRFKQPGNGNWWVQFSADGSRVLLIGNDSLAVHDLAGNVPTKVLPFAERAVNAMGWSAGPMLAWGSSPGETGKEAPLQFALDFSQMKSAKFDAKDMTRARKEWGGVKLTDDGYRATATANGKAVKLNYEPELDSDDIKAVTLVGPGHAVLVTGAGTFGYDTKTGEQVCKYPRAGGWALATSPDGTRFATNSFWDPLVRVLKPGAPEPVLTLFVAGAEWVAWTPDGAWASSEGATRFAGTLMKPVPGKLPTFVPLDPARRDPARVRETISKN